MEIGKNLISLKNVNLNFGKFKALKNINLNIKTGERIALVGHNGAGKSTLIDIILGIKKVSTGIIEYCNYKNKNIREIIGVQFQNNSFPPGIKFKDLLEFHLKIINKKKDDDYVINLLKSFKADYLLNKILKNMSGGQKQKVNIILAIINKPKIIIFDEILTGLDITSQKEVLQLLNTLVNTNKNLTILIVSHNEEEIKNIVNRVISLKSGEIINDLSLKEIRKKYKNLKYFLENLVGEHV